MFKKFIYTFSLCFLFSVYSFCFASSPEAVKLQKIKFETSQYCHEISYLLESEGIPRSQGSNNLSSESINSFSDSDSTNSRNFEGDQSFLSDLNEIKAIEDSKKINISIKGTPCEKRSNETCLAFFGCGWEDRENKCLNLPESCHEMKSKKNCSGFLGCVWRNQTNDCTQNLAYMTNHQKRCYGWSEQNCNHFGDSAGCKWINNQCIPIKCNASLQSAKGCINKPGCTNYMLNPNPECPVRSHRQCGPIQCNQLEMNECKVEPVCQWAQGQCLQRDAFVPINMVEALKHSGKVAFRHIASFAGGVFASMVAAL